MDEIGISKSSSASKKSKAYLDDLRRARAENGVQLRKVKRVNRANLQRMKVHSTDAGEAGANGESIESDSSMITESKGSSPSDLSIISIVEHGRKLYSDDTETFMVGLVGCRNLLSRIKNPPIEAFVDNGFVPRIMQVLVFDHFPLAQIEVAWMMTNIACAPVKHARLIHEAIPNLIKLFSTCKHDVLRDQVLWALSNLSADEEETGEPLIQAGLMDPLLRAMGMVCQGTETNAAASPSLFTLSHIASIVANLTRSKTLEQNRDLYSVFIVMMSELLQSPDSDVVIRICGALRRIADTPQNIDLILENGIGGRLRELVESPVSRDASLRVLAVMLQSPQRLHVKLLLASQFCNLLPLVLSELATVSAVAVAPVAVAPAASANDEEPEIKVDVFSKIDAKCVDLLKAVQNVILTDTKYIRHVLQGGVAESLRLCVHAGRSETVKYAVLVMACIVLGSPPELAASFAADAAAVLVPALPQLHELDATVYSLLAIQHMLESLFENPRMAVASPVSGLLPVLQTLINSGNLRVAELAEKVEELVERGVQYELVQ